jgi:hypothetical protein
VKKLVHLRKEIDDDDQYDRTVPQNNVLQNQRTNSMLELDEENNALA